MLTFIISMTLYAAYLFVGVRMFLLFDVEEPQSALKVVWMLTWWPYYAWRAGWAPL